ncbi:MAG: hypothetical protein K5765_09170 [Clostridia bacterium]|nr:hypothetical protein [Clostridia bacterium]
MELAKLVVQGVYEQETKEFNLIDGATQVISDVETIKKCVYYALFGNDALHKGQIEIEFTHNSKKLRLVRNFAEDKKEIYDNLTLVCSGEDVDTFIQDAIKISPEAIKEYVLVDDGENYKEATTDVESYTKNLFNQLGITDSQIKDAKEKAQNNAFVSGAQLKYVENKMDEGKDLEKEKKELIGEIESLNKQLTIISENIGVEKIINQAKTRLNELNKQLNEVENNNAEIEKKKAAIEQSKAVKNNSGIIKSLDNIYNQKEVIQKDFNDIESKKANAEKEVENYKQILTDKENQLQASIKKVKQLNRNLDKLIQENKENKKVDNVIYSKVNETAQDGLEMLKELDKIDKQLAKEKKKIEYNIAKLEDELCRITLSAEYKMQIRESSCFEAKIATMQDESQILAQAVQNDELTIDTFKERAKVLKEIIDDCEKEYNTLFGEGGKRSLEKVNEEINNREKQKDQLFRDEMRASIYLQDINAIENKIIENKLTKNNRDIDLENLNKARETLLKYRDKVDVIIEATKARMSEIEGYIHFFDGTDGMEYGSRCPVCSSVVVSKPNIEIKKGKAEKEYNELKAKFDKSNKTRDEYTERLNELNEKIGAYTSDIVIIESYVKNLEKSKRNKLAYVQEIYQKYGVVNQEQLITKLENAYMISKENVKLLTDLKAIANKDKLAREEYDSIINYLDELESNGAKERKIGLENVNNQIINLRYGLSKVNTMLNGEEAVSKLSAMNKLEKKEEEIRATLSDLYKEKKEIDNHIVEALKNRIVLEGRDTYAFSYNDKKYSYGALCVAITSETYESLIQQIREEDAQRMQLQNEYAQASMDLDTKYEDLNKICYEKEKLEDQIAMQDELSKSLTGINEDGDTSSFDKEQVSSILIAEEKEAELEKEVDDHYAKVDKLKSQIESYEEVINLYATDTDNNKIPILEQLDIKKERLEEINGIIASNKQFEKDTKELKKQKSKFEKSYKDLEKLNDENNIQKVLIDKVNTVLDALTPTLKAKIEDKKIVFIRNAHGVDETNIALTQQEEKSAAIAIVVASKLMVETILDVTLPRIVKIDSKTIRDYSRDTIRKFAIENGLGIIFY